MSFTAAVSHLRTLLDIPQELSISVAVAKMSALMGLPAMDADGAFLPLPTQVVQLQEALGLVDLTCEEGSAGSARAGSSRLELGGTIDDAVLVESDSCEGDGEASGLRKKQKRTAESSCELRQCVCCPNRPKQR